jgi:hypothetical protein
VTQLQGNTSLDDSFGELLQSALDTQRIHLMPSYVSPVDTALATDFSVGIGSVSSIAVAALQGMKQPSLSQENMQKNGAKIKVVRGL